MQLVVPSEVADTIMYENMISEWGGIPYAQLSVLLAHARYLTMVHQTHHWTTKGDSFYGDHLLFERLYNGSSEDIDVLAEKVIGLSCDNNVNLNVQLNQLNRLVQNYGMSSTIPQACELAKRSLLAEMNFLKCICHMSCSLKEQGLLTGGLDNLLAGIQDKHEGHVYLLKQRAT